MVRVVVVVVVVLVVFTNGTFAQEAPSLSGSIWDDSNADGIRQPDEPGIGFLFVRLVSPSLGRGQSVRTDEQGDYQFVGLPAGRYTLSVGSSMHFLTYPYRTGSGAFIQSLNVGAESVAGVDFGLHRPTSFSGFIGDIWINGSPGFGEVQAFIGNTDCTGPVRTVPPPHSGDYYLSVVSAELVPGCGVEGAEIRFRIDGFEANEKPEWRIRTSVEFPVYGFERLTLTVGPPFAYLTFTSTTPSGKTDTPEDGSVVAYVDGVVCAESEGYGQGGSMIVLRSKEYPDGCGYDGANVVIVRDGVEVGRTTWREGYIGEFEVPWVPREDLLTDPVYYESVYGSPPSLDLLPASPQISPPSVGDGGLR